MLLLLLSADFYSHKRKHYIYLNLLDPTRPLLKINMSMCHHHIEGDRNVV
jgi:hypothetical protein